jgi:hypothetical protein
MVDETVVLMVDEMAEMKVASMVSTKADRSVALMAE